MFSIKVNGVRGLKRLNDFTQLIFTSFYLKVIVVGEKAVGVYLPVVHFYSLFEFIQKSLIVFFILIYELVISASVVDMVVLVWTS